MSDEDETVQVADSTQSTVESLRIKLLGPVVQSKINANPGLKSNLLF